MTHYVALLRGINVGGKNLIGMPALKACFDAQGFADVVTYIQSGNVVFTSDARASVLVGRIEQELSRAFGFAASVVLRSRQQLRRVVAEAPAGFGARPALYRYDVVFLKEPLDASEALESVTARTGVDEVFAGRGVLYFSRLVRKASQSHLTRLVSKPVYKQMTIRNWNTTTRLLGLMEARAGGAG
jgi:uncharacterized protein (DUF1697 family)